jgi:hypothetical protein
MHLQGMNGLLAFDLIEVAVLVTGYCLDNHTRMGQRKTYPLSIVNQLVRIESII